jgi:hypothetical protein
MKGMKNWIENNKKGIWATSPGISPGCVGRKLFSGSLDWVVEAAFLINFPELEASRGNLTEITGVTHHQLTALANWPKHLLEKSRTGYDSAF